jgi:hypothetical protein
MSLSEVVLQTSGLISDSQKEREREQAWNEEMFDLCIQSRKSSSIAKLRVESEPLCFGVLASLLGQSLPLSLRFPQFSTVRQIYIYFFIFLT